MSVAPQLRQRQAQGLRMTPQLRQSLGLLRMSGPELEAFVETQLAANPMLERAEPDAEADPRPVSGGGPGIRTGGSAAGRSGSGPMPPRAPMPTAGRGEGDGWDPIERLEARTSLREHLERQAAFVLRGPDDRLIAGALIDALDPAGYLSVDPASVAAELDITPARVEVVLDRLRGCEPVGVFARSLADCLAMQLRERNRLDPAMAALVANLPMLAEGDLPGLRRVCGVDADDLNDMIRELRTLDPKPAAGFGEAHAPVLPPDIIVRRDPGGGWEVELNPEVLPRAVVTNDYRLPADVSSGAARAFLAEHIAAANWLVGALDRRARTLLAVAGELVRCQQWFLEKGAASLVPLTLRDVAEAVGLHESTVSRAIANKTVLTPRGLLGMRMFLTGALAGIDGGGARAAGAVRHRLRELIDTERPDSVLSDDGLVALLRAEGIGVARRTVAKYRESMGIPPAFRRRRGKAGAVEIRD